MKKLSVTLAASTLLLGGCMPGFVENFLSDTMTLTSANFEHEGMLTPDLTCDGAGFFPKLKIENAPKKTETLAVILHDPDAPRGDWVHWLAWNIPANTRSLGAADSPDTDEGTNSSGSAGYDPPCPPAGDTPHRYIFDLYALDTTLELAPGSDRAALEDAMTGHIISRAQLIGRYERAAN